MNYVQQPFLYGNSYGYVPPYQQPIIPTPPYQQPVVPLPPFPQQPLPDQQLPIQFEQSYIENILRLNRGKVATVYMNFEGSQWGSKIFKGIVLAAGRDHLILKDLQSEVRYVLLTVFLNYFTFDEEIEYEYPIRKKKASTSNK
ncbi:MAG: spore coat protein GerQ [Acholeplasmataceae bacterium]|nr:spore coat protein GerQ [Acholeplasmataceae bacterium]HOA63369.1 spore coat protein GerQ [Bacilli bacterium]HPT89058.1 spore coat protein GerQ [Bacilli bacterium]HQA19207.1 spore coat protein GerQ [Bacilli bacterium]HQD91633.1 spore coat protein GerQ [Bacilli bacterium]